MRASEGFCRLIPDSRRYLPTPEMPADHAFRRPKLTLVSDRASGHDRDHALDDTQLIVAARRGDRTAAAALHDRVRPQVDRTVARLLGRLDSDAEDLVQIALIGIVTGIGRFRGDCPLDAWVSMVTARVVYKHLRRRKLERQIFDSKTPIAPFASRAVRPETGDLLARVLGHVWSLDHDKAWAFVLHDVCGYDLREVAVITGSTVAAAQTRLVRGRRELHERILADPELAERLDKKEEVP